LRARRPLWQARQVRQGRAGAPRGERAGPAAGGGARGRRR
jgi:hypothetical protein